MANEDTKIKVFGASWCPDCKRAKQFFGEQRVPYEWRDLESDPDAVRYVEEVNDGKQIIPTIVFPDGSLLVEPSNADLAEKLGIRTSASSSFYDLIVIGGGPAGLTAALYAAREGVETMVIESKGLGGQAAVTERLDNYPGFPEGISGDEFGSRIAAQARRFDVEILGATEVASIRSDDRYRIVTTTSGDEYCASVTLLASGSLYRRLGVPGEEDFIGAGVHFCATCDGPFYKEQEVMVVGGGNSGVQEAIFLTRFASKVTLIERASTLKSSKVLLEKAEEIDSLEMFTDLEVVEMKGDSRLRSIVLRDVKTGETRIETPAAVFVFIGLVPNSEAFQGTVDTDDYGFVTTDATLQTSEPCVYAAGDIRSGSTKQVASAAGEGATAALMLRGYLNEGSPS